MAVPRGGGRVGGLLGCLWRSCFCQLLELRRLGLSGPRATQHHPAAQRPFCAVVQNRGVGNEERLWLRLYRSSLLTTGRLPGNCSRLGPSALERHPPPLDSDPSGWSVRDVAGLRSCADVVWRRVLADSLRGVAIRVCVAHTRHHLRRDHAVSGCCHLWCPGGGNRVHLIPDINAGRLRRSLLRARGAMAATSKRPTPAGTPMCHLAGADGSRPLGPERLRREIAPESFRTV